MESIIIPRNDDDILPGVSRMNEGGSTGGDGSGGGKPPACGCDDYEPPCGCNDYEDIGCRIIYIDF